MFQGVGSRSLQVAFVWLPSFAPVNAGAATKPCLWVCGNDLLVFLLLFTNVVLFDLVPEDPFADAKAIRSLGLNPLVILEGLEDKIFFDRLKGFR